MCEYCDCRRIPEIARLGEEHDAIGEIAEEALTIAQTGGPGMNEVVTRLLEAVIPHVWREEAGVFSQAKRAGLASFFIEDLEDDHRRFAAVLGAPEALDGSSLEALLDELHRHIAIEEYDLFPTVARVLGDDQWRAIAALGTH